jgi:RNA polymerase sigma-70 factor, ECF subfamily
MQCDCERCVPRNISGSAGHFPSMKATRRSGATESEHRRFERVYADHSDAVASYLLARTDRDSAADAFARSFEIAWRRLPDVPLEPLPWLLGVARRVLAEQRRAAGRHTALVERIGQAAFEAAGDDTETACFHEQVLAAIRALTPLQQEALLLTAWDGLSQREAAAALGCSRGALALRLHRARRQLRDAASKPVSSVAGIRGGKAEPRGRGHLSMSQEMP